MSKPFHFFPQNKNETKFFTINKLNIKKNLNINNIFIVLLVGY